MSSAPPEASVNEPTQPHADANASLTSMIRSMLITGHRLAIDFKNHETLISSLENDLTKDVDNLNINTELSRQKQLQSGVETEIELLSRHVANGLQIALKPTTPDSHSDQTVRDLEEKMRQLQDKTDKARSEMVNVVKSLKRNNKQLTEQVESLHLQIQDLKSQAPSVSSSKTPEDMNNDQVIQEVKKSFIKLSDRVTELHQNVVLTLSEDLPANLQQAVRSIQASLDHTTRSTIESNHRQQTESIQSFSNEIRSKIDVIEKLINNLLTVKPGSSLKNHNPQKRLRDHSESDNLGIEFTTPKKECRRVPFEDVKDSIPSKSPLSRSGSGSESELDSGSKLESGSGSDSRSGSELKSESDSKSGSGSESGSEFSSGASEGNRDSIIDPKSPNHSSSNIESACNRQRRDELTNQLGELLKSSEDVDIPSPLLLELPEWVCPR